MGGRQRNSPEFPPAETAPVRGAPLAAWKAATKARAVKKLEDFKSILESELVSIQDSLGICCARAGIVLYKLRCTHLVIFVLAKALREDSKTDSVRLHGAQSKKHLNQIPRMNENRISTREWVDAW